jgi:hypothetical protein
MNVLSRLHFYSHKEPNGTAYVVGERKSLRELAKALERAASSPIGTDTITLYGSDGHPYTVFITKEVSEEEWQEMKDPKDLSAVQIWEEVRQECQQDN